MDPNRSPDVVLDETCWSDYDFCKKTGVSCRHCQPLFLLLRIVSSFINHRSA
jgi:hypothetical protein